MDRLARDLRWSTPVLGGETAKQRIAALVLAGQRLLAAGSQGGLYVLSLEDGHVLGRVDVPAPVWDGMAVAAGRVIISAGDGRIVCLGQ